MIPILPPTPAMLAIAKRVVWFKPPEETLQDPVFFLCHLMNYTDPADFIAVSEYATPEHFRYAIDRAPAGVFDARSWAYWKIQCGRKAVPPWPVRRIPT